MIRVDDRCQRSGNLDGSLILWMLDEWELKHILTGGRLSDFSQHSMLSLHPEEYYIVEKNRGKALWFV